MVFSRWSQFFLAFLGLVTPKDELAAWHPAGSMNHRSQREQGSWGTLTHSLRFEAVQKMPWEGKVSCVLSCGQHPHPECPGMLRHGMLLSCLAHLS